MTCTTFIFLVCIMMVMLISDQYFFLLAIRLEVPDHLVRSVYLAARQLKMDMVVQECSQHLIRGLDVRNCVEIRSLPGISRNHSLVSKVDAFIAKEVGFIFVSVFI